MLLVKESKREGHEHSGEGHAQVAVNILGVHSPHMALEVVRSQETGQAVVRLSKSTTSSVGRETHHLGRLTPFPNLQGNGFTPK